MRVVAVDGFEALRTRRRAFCANPRVWRSPDPKRDVLHRVGVDQYAGKWCRTKHHLKIDGKAFSTVRKMPKVSTRSARARVSSIHGVQ